MKCYFSFEKIFLFSIFKKKTILLKLIYKNSQLFLAEKKTLAPSSFIFEVTPRVTLKTAAHYKCRLSYRSSINKLTILNTWIINQRHLSISIFLILIHTPPRSTLYIINKNIIKKGNLELIKNHLRSKLSTSLSCY